MAGEQIKRVSLRTVMCLRRMSALAHLCYGGVGVALRKRPFTFVISIWW